MWIRSQDRKLMVNLDNTQNVKMRRSSEAYDGSMYYTITCDDLEMARYSSEDQAMVRLGEIQDNICNCTDVMQMPVNIVSWKDKGSRWLPSDYGFF